MDTENLSIIWGEDIENIFTDDDEAAATEPTLLTQLTDAKSNPHQTLHLEFTNDLPEYPQSDLNGYTYVIAADMSQEEAENLVLNIQYSRASYHGTKKNIKSSFLNCPVKKWVWKCSGALICEYLKPDLRMLHHTHVNDEMWSKIQAARKNIELIEEDVCKRNAYSLYRARKAFFAKQQPCLESLPSCAPQFKRSDYPDVNGEYHPYVGCVNQGPGFLQKHYSSSVKGHTSIDLEFLEQLFNDLIMPSQEDCGVIEPLTSRRKFCDCDHVQGSGRLERIKCSVTFTALVPVNIEATPYILFTSHGIHQHPPPPPHRPPELVMKGIQKVIRQMRNPSLTLAQFIRSPELESFCQQYDAYSLDEIHASFSNVDRISAIIQKQRLMTYPAGQHFNGVIYLYNTDPFIRDYIQEKFYDAGQVMIICGFKEQIQLLNTLNSFEIDMSYKRIREKGMNEVVFATYLPSHGKIITLLRVFTNQESTEGYYLLFKRAFTLIQQVTGNPIEFYSIHSTGIHALIVDMCPKQYTGLGKYLQEIDPLQRPILWQLQGTIIFCRVHFFRTITEAVGRNDRGVGVWSRMASLIDCKSEDDYVQLCELLIANENPEVRDWAVHKRQPVIKAGLNKHCSNIPEFIYDSIRNHTNSAEQSHHKANAGGKRLTLTEAIRNSAKLDKQDILQYINRSELGIRHTYRTTDLTTNYLRHVAREESHKRQHSESASQGPSSRSISASSRGRHRASRNTLSFEEQRQALEIKEREMRLKKEEVQLKKEEEGIRKSQLDNEERELELMERRARMQENS